MAKRGLTQSQLGVPQKTISRIKRRDNGATLRTVDAIAKGCNLDVWQLFVPGMDPDRPPTLNAVRFTALIIEIAELLELRSEEAQQQILRTVQLIPEDPPTRPRAAVVVPITANQ